MESLPPAEKPAKRWNPCDLCKRSVLRGKDRHGKTVIVERCVAGKGTIALTDPLFEGDPLLVLYAAGGHYRKHSCIEEKAHSAANFERKTNPEMSDKKYSAISGASPPKGRKCPPQG